MDYLPSDPAILVSAVNMLLRDEEFDNLDQLCFSFGRDAEEVKARLAYHGFYYDEQQRQFKAR